MGIFERYLSLWVGLSILLGVVLGLWQPCAFEVIAGFEFAHVNIVVAIFIPVIIAYTLWCYKKMWRTVTIAEIEQNKHSAY